ncbi:glycerophosphodiester phosphodiesterase family protein [Clostridium sp. CCUG 7971]|uniref:glycerophosphodiester phosphodiesterase family protein n=1 Tax=Clostridium sp. CCUG 7971 TaxID=2811414 RepID=UPI001ABBB9E1|nr:glycerophosphodiester phosphodiesterase family protein [Clostridium sp. CCUG 7971]MBO3445705.1 glycerophosphodiester phosphodiesterase [Clostridium sp. CCUG 7971]
MIIFAHRGYSFKYPENTMLAFEKSLEKDAKAIELDIHKTKDDKIVVIHDEDIERTLEGKGLIKDYTLEELRKFKCKTIKFRDNDLCKIPTLEEVINLIKDKDIFLNIEAKTDVIDYKLEQDTLDIINKYGMKDKVLISSFNHESIKRFKELKNDIKYANLYGDKGTNSKDLTKKIKELELYSINIDVELATKELVQHAHDNNIKVFVYTVNSLELAEKLIEYGVDGIFTDCIELMKSI